MEARTFQEACRLTAVHSKLHGSDDHITYAIVGLCGEVGEIANKWKKNLRGDPLSPTHHELMIELGDVLWYAAELATALDKDLDDVMITLLEKLALRRATNTLQGPR